MSEPQLHTDVVFDRTQVEATSPRKLYGAVVLEASRYRPSGARAPLQLVTCIDISGSMRGAKLHEAKESLHRLVEQLSSTDELGIVAFEDRAHRVFPQTRMTVEAKERAHQAINLLHVAGSTNMSGGLIESLRMLRTIPGAVSRVLLFTDGHANIGLHEGDLPGWENLLREHAQGMSVSWFGYGEDHDGVFLSKLADLSRGNYYQASSVDAIRDAFAQELGGLLSIVARDVRITLRVRSGFGPAEVLNDATVRREDGVVLVELPDIYSEERRDILFELPWKGDGAPGERRRAIEVEVAWTNALTSRRDSCVLSGEVRLVSPGQESVPDRAVLERVAILKAAQVQRRAAELAEQGQYQEARYVVLELVPTVREVGTERAEMLARALEGIAEQYGHEVSYRSSRSQLSSMRRGLGKMRPSGSAFDGLFETRAQQESKRLFRKERDDEET